MKIECVREKLLEALNKADKVTSKNPTLAVLSSVVIGASDNQVVLKSTNLEVGLELTLPAKVTEDGVCAISASVLSSFLGNIPNEKNVSLELVEGVLKVVAGAHKANIKTVSYEDFPVIPSSEGATLELPLKEFLDGLKSVWYSASVSSIKPELGSVYVYSDAEYLVFVATDSFRLAEKRIKLKKPVSDVSFLIPYKNAADIAKVFDGMSGNLEISFNKNQLAVTLDNIYITSRLIDSVFVDYKKIIPKDHQTEVTVLKDDVNQALRMMRVFSDKFNQINVSVIGPKSTCEFSSKNSDVGEGVYAVPVKVTGETISLNFNHKYLSDGLGAVEGESVLMRFNGPGKALVIQGYNNPNFTYLVMPNR